MTDDKNTSSAHTDTSDKRTGTRVTQFTKDNLKFIRNDLEEALATVTERHGINVEIGRMTFSPNQFTCKLSVSTVATDGTVKTEERECYIAFCESCGLKPEWLDATFQIRSKTFTITGLNLRAPKKNVHLTDVHSGKTYTMSDEDVREIMTANESVG